MNEFGKRLKEERENTCLSQAEFAKDCGVGKTAQYMYEKGERLPSISYLQKAGEAGADVLYILTGERTGNDNAYSRAGSKLLYRIESLLGLKENKIPYLLYLYTELEAEKTIKALTDHDKADFSSWLKLTSEWLLTTTNIDNCIDFDLFARILVEIETYIDETGIILPAEKKAKVLIILYRIFKTSGKVEETIIEETIKLASS